ncbi:MULTISPECIES: hypothetical protein [unclassified Clostridium]|uniref:hypothetical protein n=1 Tax=Clostridium TaxID=1485 RepID=UPI001C8B5B6F|nr:MULTISPECIES: hypothetical protein [unclassified Clostridium]MBX9136102.1 hypothetical protein [Clostridium sp. K12(2020)]MBX9143266.1 hypothetical protein [Clostridium sp. K13]MDU2288962.1 hypothetical protein [Clostridium celatum]
MDFINSSILHKVFIIFYIVIIIYGFYSDIKDKNKVEKRIREKIDGQYKTEILLEIDEDEKYMLKSLAYDYGYNTIEEFIVTILNEEVNDERDEYNC